MQNLYINNKIIEVTAIQRAERNEDIPYFSDLAPYFQATLSFCRQWLRGSSSFTMHTSGSTGVPKSITITRSQMEASASMTIQALQLDTSDTALVCLNTAYIAGKMMLVRGFEAGMDLVIVQPSSLPFTQIPKNMAIRFAAMAPLQLQATLESDDADQIARFNQLKALLIGGAPVSYPLQQAIRQHITAPVYSTYGMTETVSHIAFKKLNGASQEEYTVLGDINVGIDERGCLTIQGAVSNYEKLITNDLVNLINDHCFIWLGRANHVINSGGFKIFPEKIESIVEQVLNKQAISARFFIGALPDERLGEKAVLVLEGTPLQSSVEEKLHSSLSQQLHPYELPKEIYYVQEFATTATGKIQRKQTLDLIHSKFI